MTLTVDNTDSSHTQTGEFPCVSCHTNCCKEYVIFVNAHDVYRLSVGLGVPPENFLEIYGAKDYSLGIEVKEGLIDLALKQKKGACEFLEETGDVFRCTVNDFKPDVCTHLKKDESEWKFYDELVKEWNAKHWRKKPLSAFLKFMLDKVELSLKS